MICPYCANTTFEGMNGKFRGKVFQCSSCKCYSSIVDDGVGTKNNALSNAQDPGSSPAMAPIKVDLQKNRLH